MGSTKDPVHPVPGLLQIWGVFGVAAVLGNGLRRVLPIALEPLRADSEELPQAFWVSYAGFSAFMAYAEGYWGFHKKFSPNVVRRSLTLHTDQAGTLGRVLAPMYCMELFRAGPGRARASWSFVSAITLVVALVKRLPPRPRAVVDAGVCTGLSFGIASLLLHYLNYVTLGIEPPEPPESESEGMRLSLCPVTTVTSVVGKVLGLTLGVEVAGSPGMLRCPLSGKEATSADACPASKFAMEGRAESASTTSPD
eukprot:TRINITY_DN82621_c0_g1_i1.p1 TRINITY_DN82621_c0_g1~~TRINITY_DN82621_c0_g1_i1.p1  ORF type:complete len:267 (-),score=35.15 TRINITY_DN82621_c0_g1_i1:304-1062(-)